MEYGILALIITGGAILWNAISSILHAKERKTLLNRVMARNYEEFKYYEEKYPGDIKEVKGLREEARTEREETKSTTEPLDEARAKEFAGNLEEDWDSEELNLEKIKEGLRNES